MNDIHVIAEHDNLVSVNTAIEIDLYGQVNAEFINGHQYSGRAGSLTLSKAPLSRKGASPSSG